MSTFSIGSHLLCAIAIFVVLFELRSKLVIFIRFADLLNQ